MSKSKATRSTKIKEDPDATKNEKQANIASALRKIFYISEPMLQNSGEKLNLERFFHPGKGKTALFITKNESEIMEILEFSEPRRSWLIDSDVCSNGHMYLTTAFDVTFFALHQLRKHCLTKAMSLDSIHDEEDPTAARLLTKFIKAELLGVVSDVKKVANDSYYKYNHEKAMAWLSLKCKRIAEALKKTNVHCGNSAVSQNFARSEKAEDETVLETDYLRMACDYVGGYVSLDLHEELLKHLNIPSEIKALTEEKKNAADNAKKRKSSDKLSNSSNKKQKLQNGIASKLKESGLIDEESPDDDNENDNDAENRAKQDLDDSKNTSLKDIVDTSPTLKATPLKERALSAKEKSLAKSAKGTKSIASFFGKKTTT